MTGNINLNYTVISSMYDSNILGMLLLYIHTYITIGSNFAREDSINIDIYLFLHCCLTFVASRVATTLPPEDKKS